MSSSKDTKKEDLTKLEDQAYFELRQIIEEAMQLQDIQLLNSRIASWKNKYKKLLDRPSTSYKSDFKKRIEFLLNQYYSSVTQYILNQLKLKEEKKIQNQAKALRELYITIKNTNDYDLLNKKVKKWEEKYPVSGFLRMYQKRVELYTRDKSLRENSFKQEEAFCDLVDITKMHRTIDELRNEVELWEKKYSINDKFTIDDFIKHQSEVKRFTSDEFLQAIAREEPKPNDAKYLIEEYNNKPYSNLSVQANAYANLVVISRSPNNINEMFRWVYKNSHVKFNEKYKELILNATYLEYSPTYLNKLSKPKIDMSKSSLSFDEYKNMKDIKRYAIISYFNLLLPPDKAISNDYFNKHIEIIYSKSESARVNNQIKDDSASIENIIDSRTEVPLILPNQNTNIDSSIQVELPNFDNKKLIDLDDNSETNEINVGYENPKSESQNSENLDDTKESAYMNSEQNDITIDLDTDEETKPKALPLEDLDATKEPTDTESEQSNSTLNLDADEESKPKILPLEDLDTTKEPTDTESEQSTLNLDADEESKPKILPHEDLDTTKEPTDTELEQSNSTLSLDTDKEFKPKTLPSKDLDTTKEPTDTELEQSNSTLSLDTDKEFKPKILPFEDLDTTKEPTDTEFEQSNSILNLDADEETLFNDNPKFEFDYDTIVTLSPMFFSAINNYDKQAVLIDHIDSVTTKFVKLEKSKTSELDKTIKTKNNLD